MKNNHYAAGFLAAALSIGGMLAPHAGAAEAPRGSERNTQRIIREIRHELVTLPFYNVFDHLAFQVDPNGKVVLMGSVTRPTLKSSAENVVKGIEGVEGIDNRIAVLPVSPNDDRLRLAAYRAIYGQPGLDRYAFRAVPTIHIIVNNGDVTLEGAVATAADKNLAGIKANGVSGVFSVKNNLRVDNEGANQ